MLEPGCRYEVRVQATGATRFASEQFIEIAEAQEIELALGRAECTVRVKWEWAPNTWYSKKPLPTAVPYELWCKSMKDNTPVAVGVLRWEDEKKGDASEQTKKVKDLVRKTVDVSSIHFRSADDKEIDDVKDCWSVEYRGDTSKLKHNKEVLDKIAHYLTMYADIGMQIHGRTGDVKEAPKSLAKHFNKRPKEDVVEICELLAKARAEACRDALISRGVDDSRLDCDLLEPLWPVADGFHPSTAQSDRGEEGRGDEAACAADAGGLCRYRGVSSHS